MSYNNFSSNLNSYGSLSGANKKPTTKLEKYVGSSHTGNKGGSSNVVANVGAGSNQSANSQNTQKKANPQVTKQREEGFSVYLMGANEERIKNMRKKEQMEKLKNRSNNNSRSIAGRKKWEANPTRQNKEMSSEKNDLLSNNNPWHNNLRSNEKEKNNSRSKSRHKELKSAGVDYKAVSKMILSNNNTDNNLSSKHSTNSNYKYFNSKETLSNKIEDMLSNINSMNKNVSSNLNKLTPGQQNFNESPLNKRRRNWGEPKHAIAYPDFQTSSTSQYNNIRHSKLHNNNLNLGGKDGIDISVGSNYGAMTPHNNGGVEINPLHTLSGQDKREDEGQGLAEDALNISNSFSANNSGNLNNNNTPNHNNNKIFLKSSSTSLKNSQIIQEKSNAAVKLNNNNAFNYNFWEGRDTKKNLTINHSREMLLSNTNINNINNNNSLPQKDKADMMLVLENFNNSDILNLSTNNNIFELNEPNFGSTNLYSSIGAGNNNNNLESRFSISTTDKRNLINAPHSSIGNNNDISIPPNNKNRTKSMNRTKLVTMERPFSSIMTLSKTSNTKHNKNTNSNSQNSQNPNNLKILSQPSPNQKTIPNIQFIYKSPQNSNYNNNSRPLSHIQKAKSITNKSNPTAGYNNRSIYNNNSNHLDRLSSREPANNYASSNNESNVNTNSNLKVKTQYPVISNIQQNPNKKNELISKIELLDDKKLNKLARVVEELASNNPNEDHSLTISALLESKNLKSASGNNKNVENIIFNNLKDKFNINYIKTDSINFGNININLNNNNVMPNSNKSSFSNSLKESIGNKGGESSSASFNPFKMMKKRSPSPVSNFSVISINILSNYGNIDKVGLTEVQIFDTKSKRVEIIECHVFNGNEETVNRIYNNKFHTVDESDMWTCNIQGVNNNQLGVKIELYFEAIVEVDKIIIWNFNGKDLSKGVKEVEIYKRNNFIFKGIISKGAFSARSDYATRINISNNNNNNVNSSNILQSSNTVNNNNINSNSHKQNNFELVNLLDDNYDLMHSPNSEFRLNNIKSARNISSTSVNNNNFPQNNHNDSEDFNILRTSLGNNSNNLKEMYTPSPRIAAEMASSYQRQSSNRGFGTINSVINNSITNSHFNQFCKIKLILTSNYGDPAFIGLTGLIFYDMDNLPINIEKANSIGAMPKDVNTVYDNCGDPRIFENIFNNENEVNDDYCMWLTLFNQFNPPFIEITFPEMITVSYIKFYNYNMKDELDKGVRTVECILDDNFNSQKTIILRKGIGEEKIDFSQNIQFPIQQLIFSEEELEPFKMIKPANLFMMQDYDTPYLPTGFVFKFILLNNYNDHHYIGLNGVEFYDQLGNSVLKYSNPKINSVPSSVNMLENMEEDVRVVGNLLNGFNTSSNSGKNAWLAPLINVNKNMNTMNNMLDNTFSNFNSPVEMNNGENFDSKPNTIYFIFDRPISISYIQIWNYSKTPERGVRDIQILCDDSVIYKGTLKKFGERSDSLNVNMSSNFNSNSNQQNENNASTIVLFTSDCHITKSINELSLNDSHAKHNYKFTEILNSTDPNSQSSYIMKLESSENEDEKETQRPLTLEK